jgi:hypothetical protein
MRASVLFAFLALCASCQVADVVATRGAAIVVDTVDAVEWQVSSPVAAIGASSDAEGHLFGRIAGVHVWEDGRLSIVDDGTFSVELFERSGKRVSRSGARGRGPGEFESLVLIGPFGPGQLLVYDSRLARLTVLDTAAGSIGTISVASNERRSYWLPWDIAGGRLIVAERRLPTPDRRTPGSVFWDSSAFHSATIHEAGNLPSIDLESVRPLASLPDVVRYARTDLPGSGATLPLPLGPRAQGAGRATDWVYTPGDAPVLTFFQLEDGSSRSLILGIGRKQITRADIQADFDRLVQRGHYETGAVAPAAEVEAFWRRQFEEIPFPELAPAIIGLLVDESGQVWVRTWSRPGEATRWWIVDPNGGVVGKLMLPGRFEPVWIAGAEIVGIWEDEDGSQQVQFRSLDRGDDAARAGAD